MILKNKLERKYVQQLKRMSRLTDMMKGDITEFTGRLVDMLDDEDMRCQSIENKLTVERHQELTDWYYLNREV